ncbi:MAG: tetratricopeptide repeat protein, partial [Aeoliella sp.]
DKLRDQIAAVVQRLQSIPVSDDASEEATYLIGDAYAISGDTIAAIRQFERARKQFSSSPIGIAASIAEGDLYRTKKQDYNQALVAYLRALLALEEPRAYRNRILPLSELKQRILAAHADFVSTDEFGSAIGLVDHLAPLLGRTRQLELRAATLSDWASHLLADVGRGNSEALRRESRLRFREAGVAFEELAGRQFTTPLYPDAVWLAAENYFLGQSYTSAIRMLNEYLRNEPVKRNAMALLRLGQSHLAQGAADEGIEALEECIELHPHDAALYRARLDCAKAYRDRDDFHEAEQLLLANLNGSGQSPKSPEWRDSLFELGHLLHDAGRYEESIDRLDEVIRRDETDRRNEKADQIRLAMYLIGESNRHAAETPLAELELAKTVNERESAGRQAGHYLTEALRSYEKVWVSITSTEDTNDLDRAMLRNCYMLKGTVLFQLGRVENSSQRFKEAIDAYSNVSTLYQDEPFVLETFVQIANCQRRLGQPMKARMNIDRALQLLDQMPENADFLAATNFDRGEWKLMLSQMLDW